MKERLRKWFYLVVALGILVGVGYVVFLTLRWIASGLKALNSEIAIAAIAGAVTVCVSVLSIVLGKAYETQAAIRQEHREHKIPVYEALISFMFRIMMQMRSGETLSEDEVVEFMTGFTQQIMVWGADEVLAAWVQWRRSSVLQTEGEEHGLKLLLLYEQIIFAIRRDLGHKNRDLKTGDVLALFVNDIDSHLPPRGDNAI